MHLFLTSALPFLAHDHASAAAFLTCRHNNFHASIIPEFLSDEERVDHFCSARQKNQRKRDKAKQYFNLYKLFGQTPLMQFSSSLALHQWYCVESILKPLLETKYFARTLQRCTHISDFHWEDFPPTNHLLLGLSKVKSLTKLDLGWSIVRNQHVEIIMNTFLSLETLRIKESSFLEMINPSQPAINISSPPPPATKTLRNLTLNYVDALFVTQFIPNFPNLSKLDLSGHFSYQDLDLRAFSFSLPLLTDLSIDRFCILNIESLNNLVDLSTLVFHQCCVLDLSFLTQENSLLQLTTLCIEPCGLSTRAFASLYHAPNLHVLELACSDFNNCCFQYLENMVHLRKLNLRDSNIVGDSRALKTLMQNLCQLEELNVSCCEIGNKGAIAGALYSIHSRLRVLNLSNCILFDDDLNGIGALKNTLEVLDLSKNRYLTNEGLVHCKDLVKLKILKLESVGCSINNLSPLKDCLNLEELDLSGCDGIRSDSFTVFSAEPNSFPKLRILDLTRCYCVSETVFEHLSQNNHLVHQLKELNIEGMTDLLQSSQTARNNLCQLKGIRRLHLATSISTHASAQELERLRELIQGLRNLEHQ